MEAAQLLTSSKKANAPHSPTSNLAHTLQVAERELEERSGVGSASSEGRDVLSESKTRQDELERVSNRSNVTSSDSSNCTMNSLRVCGRSGTTNHLPTGSQHPPPPSIQNDNDTVQHAGSGSGTGSGSHRTGSVHGSHHSGGGSSGLKGSATGSLQGNASSIGKRNRSSNQEKTDPSSVSSGRTGSGSGSRHSGGNTNSTVYNTMTNAQQFFMEDAVADLGEEHRIEVLAMQKLFDDNSIANNNELANLWSRITELTRGEKSRDNMMELLATARLATSESQDARDDLKDQIAGLLARIEHREEVHLIRVSADKKEAEKLAAAAKKENDHEQEDMKQRVDMARLELNTAELEVNEQKEELAYKRDAKIKHEMDLARVQELYNTTKREIARRNRFGTSDDKCDEFAESHLAEDDLTSARMMQRELHAELAEQRLELLRMSKDHNDQLAVMQARLDKAEGGEEPHEQETAKSFRKTGKQKGGKSSSQVSRGKGKLAAIEEEFDAADDVRSNAASAISGVVSSEGVGVGDLADFDDDSEVSPNPEDGQEGTPSAADEATTERLNARVADLLQQLQVSGTWNKKLLDDKSNMDAEHVSKVARMAAQLKWLRSEQYTNSDVLAAQRLLNASDRNENAEDLLKEQGKIEAMISLHEMDLAARAELLQENTATHNSTLEGLHQELYYAIESKRIETGRVADTKRELEQVAVRHRSIVEDLTARVTLSQSGQSQSGETATHSRLIDRLRELEHDRNVMKNDGDIMKVQLQTQLEQEQLQHAVAFQALENAQSDILRERQFVEDYKRKLQHKQEELQGILRDCDEASQSLVLPAPTQSQHDSRMWLDWLWCPARKTEETRTAITAICASLSAAIWQVVATVRGVVALQCCTAELQIMEASRRAFEIWGSSSLRSGGSSVLQSLVFDQRSANWLQQEIASRLQASDSFWIKQLGCLEFQSKNGIAFDSVVIAAHVPQESADSNNATIVVIVEPMGDDKPSNKWSDREFGKQSSAASSHSGKPRTINNSGSYYGQDVRSTTSSDIGPNDSVSNIF